MKKGICILFIFLLLTGCSSNYMSSLYNNEKEIASDNNSYNLINPEQTIDSQTFSGNAEFEGMDTIWTYEAADDMDIDMTYLLKLESGKVKLVLISPDDTTTTLIETTEKSHLKDYATSTLHIKKGNNRIKLVAGENTKLDFDISIPDGEFHELGM